MKKMTAIAAAACLGTSAFAVENAENIEDFFKKGQIKGQAIIGYENSSTDDGNSPGYGQVNRFRLGYQSAEMAGFSFFVQGQAIVHTFDDFRDGRDRKNADRDIIADPNGGRIHQAYVDYHSEKYKTRVRFGRQEIVYDDSRLLGNIGWRLNAQSFDALRITSNYFENLTLDGFYAKQVNSIFLEDTRFEHFAGFNAKYRLTETQNITGFAYVVDTKGGARDNVTYGLRLDGKTSMKQENKLVYDITVAQQDDYRSGTGHDGYMANAFIGAELEKVNFGAGYSRISGADSDNAFGFDTLFSTAHKFNGWSDQFLGTNGGNLTNGLEDVYFQIGTDFNETSVLAVIHFFDTIEDNVGGYNGEYGTEFDLQIKRTFEVCEGHKVKALAKYAYYNETDESGTNANPTTDEQVFWLRFQYDY